MSVPQNQTEQMIQGQIRQVYEQTRQGLQYATDPHTALLLIDTQVRTLQYIWENATKLWNCPVAARQASDLIASLYNIRPTYQAWADRTPKPPMQGSLSPSLSGEWSRMVQDYAKKNEEIRNRNYPGNSYTPSSQPGAVPWRCNAVCPQPIGYTYCGKQCALNAGHYGPHQCPDGHQWY